ncbi:hypothetical protein DFH08DRAFT_714261, partial [Mycena albidolilacea]
HLYSNRHEPKSANVPLLMLTIEPILLLFTLTAPVSLFRILSAYIVFGFTLCSSIIIYWISPWHPLTHISGPTIYKITKLWGMWVFSGSNQHTVNKVLHDKYGPFLQTGPNEVSIIHVDAIKAVLGTAPADYEPWADPALKTCSLLSLRDELHANQQRIWNRGLSSESLKDYESILVKRVIQLMDRLEGLLGLVDITEWFSYFTYVSDSCEIGPLSNCFISRFDFMGDMV